MEAASFGVASEPAEVDPRGDVGGAGRLEDVLDEAVVSVAVRRTTPRLVSVVDQERVAVL